MGKPVIGNETAILSAKRVSSVCRLSDYPIARLEFINPMSRAPEQLRDRAKAFAVRIVKLYRLLPRSLTRKLLPGSYCGLAPQSQPTIERRAEVDLEPNG
jgi:hypothetical protein